MNALHPEGVFVCQGTGFCVAKRLGVVKLPIKISPPSDHKQ